MNYAEHLREMLKRHEGIVLKPYTDSVGKITIGVGRNLTDNGITMQEVEFLLEHDIKLAELYASSYEWFNSLVEARKAVIVSMLFNMGPRRFGQFRRLHAAISAGHFDSAAAEMLDSTWHNQVGRRAEELSELFRIGVWR